MKLWQKEYNLDEQIEKFTVGKDREFDLTLAPYDVVGSVAHIKMLEKIGLLEKSDLDVLIPAMNRILVKIEEGKFVIEEGVEDVHSQVELELTRELGDIGKKIHSGRSRNDQVLVDLRLFLRDQIKEITSESQNLFDVLIEKSELYKEVLMPGYTHMQVAMVSSFGLWFGAFAESLCDDLQLLQSIYKIVNQNPLGSAAGYGSSFPLDRKMTTELLGFEDLNYNVIHAQMGRGKTEQFVSFGIAAFASTLNKLAMDACLYSNQNYQFIALPNEMTTGSSIMPHKKNPDVFELIRGRCNRLQGVSGEIALLNSNLPAGYHREYQLLKESLFPALESLLDCLRMTTHCIKGIIVNPAILNDPKYKNLYSVEHVNAEVLKGVPFRDAYQKISTALEEGDLSVPDTISHTHEGSIGNLCNEEIQAKWNRIIAGFEVKELVEEK